MSKLMPAKMGQIIVTLGVNRNVPLEQILRTAYVHCVWKLYVLLNGNDMPTRPARKHTANE